MLLTIFSGGTVLVWLAVLGFALVLTWWLPKQVIDTQHGDRLMPPLTAITANLVAALWLALFFLTWHTLKLLALPPDDDWLIVSRDAASWLALFILAPLALVAVPMLVAAAAMPTIVCLLAPVEWLVERSSVGLDERPAAVAAMLALLSGFATSLVLILLPWLDSENIASYITFQYSLAPFGLLTWFFARTILSQRGLATIPPRKV